MAIEVKLFPTLANLAKSKRASYTVDWREGLTPHDILTAEGFSEVDIDAVMAVVNDEQAKVDRPLADGDRLELRVNVQGGQAAVRHPEEDGMVSREELHRLIERLDDEQAQEALHFLSVLAEPERHPEEDLTETLHEQREAAGEEELEEQRRAEKYGP